MPAGTTGQARRSVRNVNPHRHRRAPFRRPAGWLPRAQPQHLGRCSPASKVKGCNHNGPRPDRSSAAAGQRIPSVRIRQGLRDERHLLHQRRHTGHRLSGLLGSPAGRPRPVLQRSVGRTRRLPLTGTQRACPRPGLADRGNCRRCRHGHPRLGGRAADQPHLGSHRLRQNHRDQGDHRHRRAAPAHRVGGRRARRPLRRPCDRPDLKRGRSASRAGRIRIDRPHRHPPPGGTSCGHRRQPCGPICWPPGTARQRALSNSPAMPSARGVIWPGSTTSPTPARQHPPRPCTSSRYSARISTTATVLTPGSGLADSRWPYDH